jgi:hypothetical protein
VRRLERLPGGIGIMADGLSRRLACATTHATVRLQVAV